MTLREFILRLAYPIGSLYYTDRNLTATQLNQLFGGTWRQLKDVYIYGNNTVGLTGGVWHNTIPSHSHTVGSHTHTSSTVSMGNHRHGVGSANRKNGSSRTVIYQYGTDKAWSVASYGHSHSGATSNLTLTLTNNNDTYGNLPPTILVGVWERIA